MFDHVWQMVGTMSIQFEGSGSHDTPFSLARSTYRQGGVRGAISCFLSLVWSIKDDQGTIHIHMHPFFSIAGGTVGLQSL